MNVDDMSVTVIGGHAGTTIMPLLSQVSLGTGGLVLYWNASPSSSRASLCNIQVCLLVMNGRGVDVVPIVMFELVVDI